MPERTRTPKSNSVPQAGKQKAGEQKEESRSSQAQPGREQPRRHDREQHREQPSHATNAWDRRTRSISPDPVDPAEEAMDIAIGGEGKPWVHRKRTA